MRIFDKKSLEVKFLQRTNSYRISYPKNVARIQKFSNNSVSRSHVDIFFDQQVLLNLMLPGKIMFFDAKTLAG